jgi:hypothetical protein
MNTMRQQAACLVKQLHKSQQIRRMSTGKIDKAVEEKEMRKWKVSIGTSKGSVQIPRVWNVITQFLPPK